VVCEMVPARWNCAEIPATMAWSCHAARPREPFRRSARPGGGRRVTISKDAFETQVLAILGPLHGVARRLTKNEADAEDLVAESITRAWRARASLADAGAFRAWMFRILSNTFISERCTGGDVRPSSASLSDRSPSKSSTHNGGPGSVAKLRSARTASISRSGVNAEGDSLERVLQQRQRVRAHSRTHRRRSARRCWYSSLLISPLA
jgi:DNA-directed RNA polymerase specialized sigma24 family protein